MTAMAAATIVSFNTVVTVSRGGMKNAMMAIRAPEMVVVLDEALSMLESHSARQARVVECRFFAGYSIAETAEILGVSERTVKREWAVARTRLYQMISEMLAA